MEPATKQDLQQLKADIAEMLTEQTKTLLEHIDATQQEMKRELMDMRGSMLEEIARQLEQHVTTKH